MRTTLSGAKFLTCDEYIALAKNNISNTTVLNQNLRLALYRDFSKTMTAVGHMLDTPELSQSIKATLIRFITRRVVTAATENPSLATSLLITAYRHAPPMGSARAHIESIVRNNGIKADLSIS